MKTLCVIVLAGNLLTQGCLNLQKVNNYSEASLKSLDKFQELKYNFNQACREKCRLEQIRNLRLTKGACDCSNDRAADSVMFVLFDAVQDYFKGLSKLSANELTNFKTDGLAKSLKSGQFGEIKIAKAEVDAYTKLSGILMKALSDGFRRQKIKTYVGEANENVQILMSTLDFIVSTSLSGKLNVHTQRSESLYFDFVNDSLASAFEKKRAIDEYNGMLDDTETTQKQIHTFSKSLKSISRGHQTLYDGRNKMSAKEIRLLLAQHATDLEELVLEFNKLKR